MNNIDKKLSRAGFCAAVWLALISSPSLSDNTTGYIWGAVSDPTGHKLALATVEVKNRDTGLSRTVTSKDDGSFRFPLLPPGTYDISASLAGFTTSIEKGVKVGIGGKTKVGLALASASNMEVIEVRGNSIAAIDTTSSESGLVVDTMTLERIPVPRNLSAIAMLAPGTSRGDSGFGDLVSFGGSSVAENATYINGLNVTNFRTGLGYSDVPWEMYQTFEVKTGGYSAEFGRATGGVINAKTKSGTNEFKAGATVRWAPDSLREIRPDVRRTEDGAKQHSGEFYWVNHKDEEDNLAFAVWASGAIIQDRLFYYAIYNPIFNERKYATSQFYYEPEADDAFWGAKLDFNITDEHILEFTFFSDNQEFEIQKTAYNPVERQVGEYWDFHGNNGEGRGVSVVNGYKTGTYYTESGGESLALKYTGVLSDDFTMSLMYGRNESQDSSRPEKTDTRYVYERYTGVIFSEGTALRSFSISEDEREQIRLDFDWYLGDHAIRFGLDYEKLEASDSTSYVGPTNSSARLHGCYSVNSSTDGNDVTWTGNMYDWIAGEADDLICTAGYYKEDIYENSGAFESKNYALYIQDQWQITDEIVLNLGIRNDRFQNYTQAGEKFIDLKNQWAPRIGAVWDIGGHGDTKLSLSFGRFYLPVAANTNVRMAGAELNIDNFWNVNFPNPQAGGLEPNTVDLWFDSVYADGSQADPSEFIDKNLDPMYQDELMLAFEQSLSDDWAWGVRATYRDLKVSIEDIAIDYGFNQYVIDTTGQECTACDGFHYYVLTNPGEDITVETDPDGDDGPLTSQRWNVPASYLGYPEAERQYLAWDLSLERLWQGDWSLSLQYTWAHSWGNTEGWVNSDIEQDDSGITQSFDQPGLMEGGSGNLPNDRRHTVKMNGAYALGENWTLGFNAIWQSGRPRSCLSFHPTDSFASRYEAFSFYCHGVLSPRGSEGRTPSFFMFDLNMRYTTQLLGLDTTAQVQIYNLFNEVEVLQYEEAAELYAGSDNGRYIGTEDYDYGLASSYTEPRYMEFSLIVNF